MRSPKSLDNDTPPSPKRSERIPAVLQAVFLASNRGEEVNVPPSNGAAFKVFESRHWIFQRSKAVDEGLTPLAKRRDRERERYNKAKHSCKNSPKSSKKNLGHQDDQTNNKSQIPEAPSVEVLKSSRRGSMAKYIACSEDKECSKSLISPSVRTPGTMAQSPQQFMMVMLKARGYSTGLYPALRTGYRNAPTPLQKASYHANLIEMVRNLDLTRLDAVFRAGISPNPCNDHGESLVHVACRLGQSQALETMVRRGATLQVCDVMGRTPMHDACWKAVPSFETVDLVARQDITLFRLADARGAVPLTYVRRDQWGVWVDYLYSKRDEYWPRRQVRFDGEEPAPPLIKQEPHSNPVPDPRNALTPKLAELVVSGRMTPKEVRALMDDGDDTTVTESVTTFNSSFDFSLVESSFCGTNSYATSTYASSTNSRSSMNGNDSDNDISVSSSCDDGDDDSVISLLADGSMSNLSYSPIQVIPERIEI